MYRTIYLWYIFKVFNLQERTNNTIVYYMKIIQDHDGHKSEIKIGHTNVIQVQTSKGTRKGNFEFGKENIKIE